MSTITLAHVECYARVTRWVVLESRDALTVARMEFKTKAEALCCYRQQRKAVKG